MWPLIFISYSHFFCPSISSCRHQPYSIPGWDRQPSHCYLPEVARLLIAQGLDINVRDKIDVRQTFVLMRLFHEIAFGEDAEPDFQTAQMIKFLLENNADISLYPTWMVMD
eukprot:TRINITY_DN12129_c1_g2_i12.p3 TRINITY_DN12129_c1_g2~~TRINITY_DN12129_c1_g2_i12.p3  ORF type:complete len:111 (+),score=5.68 TRINITY_DN12129_c1_g2_i12:1458-1790(+)